MLDYYLAGFCLRAAQILVDSATWIAFGFFVAAIMKRMIGPEKIRVLFGSGRFYGVLIGWAAGMLLPVCSLGAIPVVRELHRARVRGGTIIAFGLTAPLFNPLSVLYGLTLSDPIAIIIFTFSALVIVSVLGIVWDRFHSIEPPTTQMEDVPKDGLKRSAAVVYSATVETSSRSFFYILIGIACSTTLATLTPHGLLQTSAEPDKVFAPTFMAFFVTPIYSTPVQVMSQIGSMFQHGNSIGAAFSLLILGAGTNIGLLFAFGSMLGFKRLLVFLLMLWGITIGIAYALDKPLYPKGVSSAGHTHAFDVYTHPYPGSRGEMLKTAVADVEDYRTKKDFGATYLLGAMFLVGLILRFTGRFVDFEAWFKQTAEKKNAALEVIIPAWVIGLIACVALIAMSIAGAFLYYPPANELLEDLFAVNTNCVVAAKTKEYDAAQKWILYCDDLSRRLEVGEFMRHGKVSKFQSAKAKVYREALDELRHAIEDGDEETIKEFAQAVSRAYMQMSKAFKKK